MTGRRPIPSPFLRSAVRAAALATCVSLAVGCGAVPGSGEDGRQPVKIMTWAPEETGATDQPGMPALAQAYARWVNSRGGIDGHRLDVITCNDHNDTVGATACARRAVKEEVAAVVGSYSQHGRAFLSPLEAADIPYIGGYGVTDEEFTSPLSYPVNGGQAALLAGNGRQLAGECPRVSIVRPDTVAGDALPELLDAGLAAAHRNPAADIPASEDATDYALQAQRALDRDGCVSAVMGDRTDTFFDSYRRAQEEPAEKRKIASVLGSVDQSLIDRSGGSSSAYEGAYVTGWYPVAQDRRWDPMRKVIREHAFGDNRIDPADAGAQTTWIAYTVLHQVVEALDTDTITSRAVARALDDGLRIDTGGLTPPLRWRFQDLLAARDFPRLVNGNVTFQVVRDGRLVAAGKGAVDMSRTLADAR